MQIRAFPSHLWDRARIVVLAIIVVALSVPSLYGQSTGLSGVVTDATGGVVPEAEIAVMNEETGLQRSALSDGAGRYAFAQLPPGTYTLVAVKEGFESVITEGVMLLVNTNVTNDVVFGSVEAVTETVSVSASGVQVNTTDASVGNAFGTKPIRQLPLNARNPAGLLSLQAGVTFLSADPLDARKTGDIRNGSVNGAQSDQSNVTLDGVDVNDQNGRLPFTSVLRNTLDSIQEFRVVTTTANADQGRSAGAQVSLVTKSGTNEMHGSLYEFHRNTATAANDFFNNRAGVDRAKLIRNIFGVSVGGPVKKDRAFFFANYEGRRDASEGNAVRKVPGESMRNGFLRYRGVSGAVQELDPAFIRSNIDPLQVGPSPAALEYFRSFPAPNDSTVGDGLNTAGYRFSASTPLIWNTFISRLDWNVDRNGAHRMFMRGNYQNDSIGGVPQFPGQPPNRETRDNSRGLAFGYTALLGSSAVSNFRYGFTGQKVDLTGVQTGARVSLGDSIIDDLTGTTTPQESYLPTHTVAEDISVMRGPHSLQFGAVFRSIRNRRLSFDNSFHFAKQAAWALLDGPAVLDGPLVEAAANPGVYRETMASLLGLVNFYDANYNYDLDGNPLAGGDPVSRTFGMEELELYAQDTWRVKTGPDRHGGPALVAHAAGEGGERTSSQHHAIHRTVHREPSGLGSEWSTHARSGAPRLRAGGRPARRASVGDSHEELLAAPCRGLLAAVSRRLPGQAFRRPGKDIHTRGRGTLLQHLRDEHDSDDRPERVRPDEQGDQPELRRRHGATLCRAYGHPRRRASASAAGGPGTPNPTGLAWSQGVDSSVLPPYSINPTFSLARELGGGFLVEAGYVGRLSRRLLVNDTAAAQYVNFKDPASGGYLLDSLRNSSS